LNAARIIASAPDVSAKMETEWGTYTQGELGRFVNFELGEKSIARDEQLDAIRTYLSDTISGHGKFLATWAAPGSGKSHMMAEVARNVSEEQWKGSDGRKLVPLLVSFNHSSIGVVYELRGLVVRLVATYLCGVVESWTHTAKAIDRCLPAGFSVEDFAAIVRVGGGMPVFLIDEISKAVKREGLAPLTASDIETIHEMRKELCMQLFPSKGSLPGQLTGGAKMLVTSLDSIVARYEPGSRAARDWIDLPAIPVEKLEDSDEVTNACKKHRLVKPFLALCGGHPRSIGNMVRAILPMDVNVTRGLLEQFGAAAVGAIGKWLDRDVVAPVLLSSEFTLDTATLDSSPRARAVDNALGRGVLLGTVANDAEKTTPAMSFFALRKWLNELTHDAVWTKSRVDRLRLWIALVGDNAGAGGCGFESLHAHAMAIRSVARAIVRATDGDSDVLPLFGDKAVFAGVKVLHGSGAAINVRYVERTGVFKLSHNLVSQGAKVHAGAWVCEGDELAVDTLDATTVFAPGDTNAGFDFVELYDRADSGKHLVLTECKYSDRDASTTFGIGDATGKMASVDKFLKATLADKSCPIVKAGIKSAKQVTLVFAVYRDSTGDVAGQIKAEANSKGYEFGVAHASKAQLSALYGRTLVPLFNFQSATGRFASTAAAASVSGAAASTTASTADRPE
jgi:hypothetical protein